MPASAPPPSVVVGLSEDATSPPDAGRLAAFASRLQERLTAAHPEVGWEVRPLAREGVPSLGRVSVGSLLRRGRSRLLAEDVDVALVLTDAEPELRGRAVTSHVSPVQQTAVLYVAPGEVGLEDDAARAVAAVVGLDGSTDDAHELLQQLAGNLPPDARGTDALRRTVLGNLRLLVTLVRGNRPWLMTLHLTRTLTGAFAASFLAVVTPDFWLLADRMRPLRLAAITVSVLAVLVGVLVVGGNLRERAPRRSARRAVLLHNTAVWASVTIGVVTLYVGLVAADLLVTAVVLPGRLLTETLGHGATVTTSLQVGMLTSAVALVGSAFGAGLEDDEDVHTAAYTGSDDARFADEQSSPSS